MTVPSHVRTTPRSRWQEDASCIGMPLDVFFGSDDHPMTNVQARRGRAVCKSCPVRRDCLMDALLANERNGIRGGYLGGERRNALVKFSGSISAAMAAFDRGEFYTPKRKRR